MKLASRNLYAALLRMISQKEERVARMIEGFLSEREPTRKQQMTRVAEVKAILAALDALVAPEAKRVVEIAYEQSRKATLRTPEVSVFPEESNFSKIHRDSINLLADNLVNTLGEATSTLGRRTEDAFRRHGLRTAANQLTREQPIGAAARRMEERLKADGLTAFVDRAGRRWSLTTYCNMAVRTTIAEADAQATMNAMLSRGLDLIVIRHKAEGAHPDDECSAYEDKVFSLNGRTPGYPVLDRLWPFHPNCDHHGVPAKEGLAVLRGDRRARAAA